MSLASDLATRELKRQQSAQADRDWAVFKSNQMVKAYPALWDEIKAHVSSFVDEYNSHLPAPGLAARFDRGFEVEIAQQDRTLLPCG